MRQRSEINETLNIVRLQTIRSEVKELRDEAMWQRSRIHGTLKIVLDDTSCRDCGCASSEAQEQATQDYFNGNRRVTMLSAQSTKDIHRLSMDVTKDGQSVNIKHLERQLEDVQADGQTRDAMKELRKCEARNCDSTASYHLNLALLETNKVFRCFNEDIDFISWLIAQKLEQ